MTVLRGNNRVGLGINKRNLQYDAVLYLRNIRGLYRGFQAKVKSGGGTFQVRKKLLPSNVLTGHTGGLLVKVQNKPK